MAWEALASGAAGLAGGVVGMIGQHQANQANRGIANAQMEFQREMSNTAHQREMADLKKAGLNPLLTATGGAGASSPVGASATMENAHQSGLSSAFEAAKVGLDAARAKEDINNARETGKLIKAQTNKTGMETHVLSKGIPEAEAKNILWNKGKNWLQKLETGAKSIMNDPWVGKPAGFSLKKPVQNPNKHGLRDFQKKIIQQRKK